ncbi:DUF817 domain-containing protein [Caulobacter sp. 602-2]|uniref:DUF817 domain-containing protein n=1 Tax=Caulobacter sp. 602-2 TaxID=2710887 RepID=A0A6G4R1Q3_9CAUL|nr:DUF817 domain-containing protein [Caulobacter sp. 602-2]NGM51647.1 DUF817 domain-containing protein [Caulobacter sp. 602-2]
MDLKSRIKDGVATLDRRMRPWAQRSQANGWAYEFLLFGLKQAWACLFGGLMLVLLVGTYLFWPHDAALARYDFLVLASVAIQALLLLLKLERWDEAAVILIFHMVGTVMEIFKTAHGSWIYPEDSLLRIGDVPLFTGFMYACVGSYIARIWRLFDITFIRYPPFWSAHVLAVLIYLNFFTHHYVTDMRLGLFVLSALLFGRTWFVFTPDRVQRRMPMLLGLMLVALFIWLAENLGTAAGAWIYPSQREGWHMVPIEKLGAWYLLMTISFVLVSLVHRPLDACVERLREGIRGAV